MAFDFAGAPPDTQEQENRVTQATELDVIEQALSRVGEKLTRYDGRFAPHNTELSLRTVPGGAIDLVFDNAGKLLSISRRHSVMEG